jgi:hypothetical protein
LAIFSTSTQKRGRFVILAKRFAVAVFPVPEKPLKRIGVSKISVIITVVESPVKYIFAGFPQGEALQRTYSVSP